jgi:hypothetical protein
MVLPVVSVSMKKKKKPSLPLTLSCAGLLIAGGIAAYCLLTQGRPLSRDLPLGTKIIPQDALFAVSLTTDTGQWQKLREFGTKETQKEVDKNLLQWRERLLNSNGYDFQKDIQPWVGEEVTIAILAPGVDQPVSKPVANNPSKPADDQQIMMVLPIKKPEAAQETLANLKPPKQGSWSDRTYQGVKIKETQGEGTDKFSATVLLGNLLVITDNSQAIEKAIDVYKGKQSLAQTPGFADNFPKIAAYKPLAQFYVNLPTAAKIASISPKRPLPAQVLAQLKNNQGLAGTFSLESEGIRLKSVSWLNPNGQRVLAVENKAGEMQNRLPGDTLIMLSGVNLQRFWGDYVSTSQGNPLSPIPPEALRNGVKNYTNLDLERDLLTWMNGEFSLSVVPVKATQGAEEDFRAAFVFMAKTNNRSKAEATLKQLDEVMKNQYQFQIQETKVGGSPVVNWVGPFGNLAASRGWMDGDTVFLALGAPVSEKILPKPNNTLAGGQSFKSTVPRQPSPSNGQFFIDVETTAKNFPLPSLLPNQEAWLSATRSIGMSGAVSDERSNVYDIFFSLKKAGNPEPLP